MALINLLDCKFVVRFCIGGSTPYIELFDGGDPSTTLTKGRFKIIDPASTVIYKNNEYGTASWSSPDISAIGGQMATKVYPNLDSTGKVVEGVYSFYYEVTDGVDSTVIQKNYNFAITYPTNSIDYEIDCDASKLSITDESTYVVRDYSGSAITGTPSRTWNIGTPANYSTNALTNTSIGGALSTFDIGSGTSVLGGRVLYTGTYSVRLTTVTRYNLENWISSYSLSPWIYIILTQNAVKNIDVSCSNCLCDMINCYVNFYNAYKSKMGDGSLSAYDRNAWKDRMLEINTNFELYNIARNCGEDTLVYCERIKELLASTVECCTSTPDPEGEPIVPISGYSSGGSSYAPITFGSASSGLPTVALLNQTHVFTSTAGSYTQWDVYWYNGSWVYMGNIKGASGSSSSSGATLLYSDILSKQDDNDPAAKLIAGCSYTLPSGSLATSGDYIHIESNLTVKATVNTTLYLKVGGVIVLSHNFNPLLDKSITLSVDVYRTGASTHLSYGIVNENGNPSYIITKDKNTTGSITWGSDNSIEIWRSKVLGGAAGDVTCNYFKIIKYV